MVLGGCGLLMMLWVCFACFVWFCCGFRVFVCAGCLVTGLRLALVLVASSFWCGWFG